MEAKSLAVAVMHYLRLKNSQTDKVRRDGTKPLIPLVIRKSRKYGRVIDETPLSRKKHLFFIGGHHAGKTHLLVRLHSHALDIWGGHTKAQGTLYLAALAPLGAWHDQESVITWYEKQNSGTSYLKTSYLPWKRLPGYERDNQLAAYCANQKVIVFIDDAHRLTGRKADVAKRCAMGAKRVILTTSAENRLPPALRLELERNPTQTITLSSEAAYDATSGLLWALIAGAALLGQYELALVLASLKFLARGRSSARQD